MSIRIGSREAYKEIIESGHLNKMQQVVFAGLVNYGPCTASELYNSDKAFKLSSTNSNFVTRLGELRDKGVVKELPKRHCGITGKKVIVWAATGELPVKVGKKKTKSDIIKELREQRALMYDAMRKMQRNEFVNIEKTLNMVDSYDP